MKTDIKPVGIDPKSVKGLDPNAQILIEDATMASMGMQNQCEVKVSKDQIRK